MEAAQYKELLDIAVSPAMKFEYYEFQRAKYKKVISQVEPQVPPPPPDFGLKADSVEAKEAVMSIFRSVKRGMGYGG